jgi:hypothetical protein
MMTQPLPSDRYAATTWGGSPYTELMMPSGQLCLVRKLQPLDLIGGETFGATDLLSQIVQERIAEARTGPQDHKKPHAAQRAEDERKITEALTKSLSSQEGLDSMIDAVVVQAVVEPRVELAPKDFSDRREGVVYADTILFGDKMFIFNWTMKGIDQLKQFRQQPTESVADLESRESVPPPTE